MDHIYTQVGFGEDWFSYPNLYKFFVDTSKDGSKIVEIGCWKGKSIAFLAVEIINSNKCIDLFAVDTWGGSSEHQNDPIIYNDRLFDVFMSNIKPVEHIIKPMRMKSLDAARKFDDNELDIVFIDASHEYEDVKADIAAWMPKVKQGGIIAGHDYSLDRNSKFYWPGVSRAVDEIFDKNRLTLQEYCWMFRK
jgi:SAM-dependent methyltransferase